MCALIHDLKSHNCHHVRELYGRRLIEAGQDLLRCAELLVPLPLHHVELVRRRFKQSAPLSFELSRLTGIANARLAPGADPAEGT